jgi:hypothetical protein
VEVWRGRVEGVPVAHGRGVRTAGRSVVGMGGWIGTETNNKTIKKTIVDSFLFAGKKINK